MPNRRSCRDSLTCLLLVCFAAFGAGCGSDSETATQDTGGHPQADAAVEDANDGGAEGSGLDASDGGQDSDARADEEVVQEWKEASATRDCAFTTLCIAYPLGVIDQAQIWCHAEAEYVEGDPRMQRAMEGDRVEFDREAIRECQELLDDVSSCDTEAWFGESSPCSRMIRGKQTVGDSCMHSVECSGDQTYCEIEGTCGGTCTKLGGLGDVCQDPADCAQGLFCDLEAGECVEQGGQGDSCESNWQCAGGSTCCVDEEICAAEELMTCVALREEGESCSLPTVDQSAIWCADELHCIDGVCQAGGQAGDACSEEAPCQKSMRCVDEVCHELSLPGETCDSDANCPATHYCSSTDKCEPLPVDGESCEDAGDCFIGECVEGVCRELADGETCTPGRFPDCQSRACRPTDDGYVCQSPSEDASCVVTDWECPVGHLCEDRQCVELCAGE